MKPEEVAEFTRLLEAAQQPTSLYRDHARAHFALSEFVTAHAADFLAALPELGGYEAAAPQTDEQREWFRRGRRSTKPVPYTKHECDLCQESLEDRAWRWVEEGWSLACERCWRLIEVAALQGPQEERERCAKIVEEYGHSYFGEAPYFKRGYMQRVLNRLAARIRAEAAHGGTPRP